MKRGIVEIDLLVSLSLFVIFIVIVSMTITSNFVNYKQGTDEEVFTAKATSTMEFLAFSPGQPTDWETNASAAEELGFSYYDNRAYPSLIDYDKINASLSLSIEELRQLTDTKDIKISFEDIDYNLNYTIGAEGLRKNVIYVEKIVAIRYSAANISRARMIVTVWD